MWLCLAGELAGPRAHRQEGRRLPTREILHVAFSIANPIERWTQSRRPAINPAFALAEVVWILNGHSDAGFPNYWNSQLAKFAGECNTYHGAYGRRLRGHFGVDQLRRAALALRANPNGRQIVLQIWDPRVDLPNEDGSPMDSDIPCNVTSLLKVRDGKLDWVQVMRSNDLFLGLPYNLIQFTTLQEVLAGWIGVQVGEYHHISDSLHIYEDHLPHVRAALDSGRVETPANSASVSLGMEASINALQTLDVAARELTRTSLDRTRLWALIKDLRVPGDFANWFLILAAEAARRRGWLDVQNQVASLCSNPVLTSAWSAWTVRISVPAQNLVSAATGE